MKIIKLGEKITAANDREAEALRQRLKEKGILLINLMSAAGSGKTTLLSRIIKDMKETRIGVMEADIASDVDAKTMADAGVRVIQLHSAGLCHMDADMTARGLESFGTEGLDLIFLENIGNLVCPAEFDVGADFRMMILSVPEGDDKPLKYPLMFTVSDVMVVNKIDAAAVFDFDFDAAAQRARALNPDIEVHRVSAVKGTGMDELAEALAARIEKIRKGRA